MVLLSYVLCAQLVDKYFLCFADMLLSYFLYTVGFTPCSSWT